MASDEPAPGGGAATAVAVALTAGLSGMSARPSADYLVYATELAERADRLRRRVAPLAQEDATAYGHVLAAYRNQHAGAPVGLWERIRTALSAPPTCRWPIAEAGAEVAARLAREGNPNLRGEAVATALLAEAGVRAAAVLVEINTTAGDIFDDRIERAGEFVASAGAAREISEGDG